MTRHRLFLFAALSLASPGAFPQYPQGEVPLFTSNVEGKVVEYSIPESRAEKLPKWDPTQTSIPLPIPKAVARAQAWLKPRNPKIDSFIPNRIELFRVSYGRFFGLWYYTVHFDAVIGKQRLSSSDLQAVVLMDGTIVESHPGK